MKKIFLLAGGFLGAVVFLLSRYSLELGICFETVILPNGYEYCRSFAEKADYLWPLWNFSRALVVVGILVLIRPALFRWLAVWTGVAFVAAVIGVLIAPSISSDFLLPVEKKSVGAAISAAYLVVSVSVFFWDRLRNKTAAK